MNRICINCGVVLIGRTDKKFCDDQCRSHYNNKIKMENNSTIKSVNQILKRNRCILERFNPAGKTRVTRIQLITAGFDLNFHTHIYHTQKGDPCVFCYDYGYQKLTRNEFLLIKSDVK